MARTGAGKGRLVGRGKKEFGPEGWRLWVARGKAMGFWKQRTDEDPSESQQVEVPGR